jgi:flagellar assembly protein FliH
MTTLSRIKGSNIKLGDSYKLGNDDEASGSRHSINETAMQKALKDKTQEIINGANDEAEKIINAARQEAENLINQAQDAIAKATDESVQAGYKAGYDEGHKKIHEELIEQVKKVDTIAASSFNVKKEIISSAEKEILQLAIAISEKIIKQQLEINTDIILNIVKAAIMEIKDKEEISIIVNPSLTKCLYDHSDELKKTIKGLKSIKIVEDKSIPSDGLIVESPESRVDARLESQIGEIARHIMLESEENPVFAEIPKEIEIRIEEPSSIKENDD